ncbi:MAG: hypothetical protein ACFFBU_04530 [Promethearchaeota archaeon]
MAKPKPVSGMLAALLFLLYPLVGEFLFIDTIINDIYTRRRIRVMFTLVGLAIIVISFSGSELIIFLSNQTGFPLPANPVEMRYLITGVAAIGFLILFFDEGWRGRVSFEKQIDIPEDRISIFMNDSREIFTTLNRILDAAQLRRHKYSQCDNSRLASYAVTVLSEYLQTRVFSGNTNDG